MFFSFVDHSNYYFLANEELFWFSFSVSGRSLRLFKYDVSSAPISVHLPVSRFLAGMDLMTSLLAFQISKFTRLKILNKDECHFFKEDTVKCRL